jgi:hypothetical protein
MAASQLSSAAGNQRFLLFGHELTFWAAVRNFEKIEGNKFNTFIGALIQ